MAQEATQTTQTDEPLVSAAELQEMLQAKTREAMELQQEVAAAQAEVAKMKARTLVVHEENQLIKANPIIAQRKAEMDYYMAEAERFIKSGAFPSKMTPEQAYTLIRAGEEMGLKPITAINSLYIVKGKIELFGKALTRTITRAGYTIDYVNEDAKGLVVHVTGPDGFDARETVEISDPILQRSLRGDGAMKISAKNKMRFHGLRRILNFRLAHLIDGVSDLFTGDYQAAKAEMLNSGKGPQSALDLSDKDVELISEVTDLLERLAEKGPDLRAEAAAAKNSNSPAWHKIAAAWDAGNLTETLLNNLLNPHSDASSTN